MEVTEGGVTIEAPEQPDAGVGEGVFFNPDQELNRDLTVASLRALRDREGWPEIPTYLDATAATGIRGVRAAVDGWDVTWCDRDPDAAALCRANRDRNDVAGRVATQDVNALLYDDGPFDVVDVDPFGSPMGFAAAACAKTQRALCVTATDTAPLCGAHFDSGVRSYDTIPRNTEYHAEMGVRVLLSALVRVGARHDVGLTPLLTHATDHYVRTVLTCERNATAANAAVEELGFLHHCPQCRWRTAAWGRPADPPDACEACGEGIVTAGPLWLGETRDPAFVEQVADAIDPDWGTADRASSLLDRLSRALDRPTHYDQHVLTRCWGRTAPAMDDFLDALRNAGFAASRTHYGGTTFETDASVAQIEDATAHLG
jgi:tRNA (guanine26-N2/guanine27-N2)-dimethyltransferase